MTKKVRNIFLVIFILSTLFGWGVLMTSIATGSNPIAGSPTEIPESTPRPGEHISQDENPSMIANNLALFSSLVASLISLIGFVTTTVITWRKEKRESTLAAAERIKLEIEIEKSRLELEELKKERNKKE